MPNTTTELEVMTPAGEMTLEVEFDYEPGEKPVRGGAPDNWSPGSSPEFTGVTAVYDKVGGTKVDTDGLFTLLTTSLRWQRLGDPDKRIYYFERTPGNSTGWTAYKIKPGEILYAWGKDMPPHADPDRWQNSNVVSRVVPLDEAIEEACIKRLADGDIE